MADLIICNARLEAWGIRDSKCETCGKRRMLWRFYAWYGPEWACLNCGEEWNEDGRKERPFMPKWREKAVARLTKRLEYLKEHAPDKKG